MIDNVFEEERDLDGDELRGDEETHGENNAGLERGGVVVEGGGGPEVLTERLEDADVAGAFILLGPLLFGGNG